MLTWYEDRNQKIYQLFKAGTPTEKIADRWLISQSWVLRIVENQKKIESKAGSKQ
jgi:Mor family transcriptional regulator